MPSENKTDIRSDAVTEALVITALTRLGGRATSNQIWRLVDEAFSVSFEARRICLESLIDRQILFRETVRDRTGQSTVLYGIATPLPLFAHTERSHT